MGALCCAAVIVQDYRWQLDLEHPLNSQRISGGLYRRCQLPFWTRSYFRSPYESANSLLSSRAVVWGSASMTRFVTSHRSRASLNWSTMFLKQEHKKPSWWHLHISIKQLFYSETLWRCFELRFGLVTLFDQSRSDKLDILKTFSTISS